MATATLDFEKPLLELEKQIDELKRLAELALERRDLVGDVQLALTGELLQLVDLLFQLQKRFFEVQCGRGHRDMLGASARADEMHPLGTEQSP